MRMLRFFVNFVMHLLVVPAVTFVLSLLFQFNYSEAIQQNGTIVLFFLYMVLVSIFLMLSGDEDCEALRLGVTFINFEPRILEYTTYVEVSYPKFVDEVQDIECVVLNPLEYE